MTKKILDLGSNSIPFNTISRPLKRRKCEGKGKRSEEEGKKEGEGQEEHGLSGQRPLHRCSLIPQPDPAPFSFAARPDVAFVTRGRFEGAASSTALGSCFPSRFWCGLFWGLGAVGLPKLSLLPAGYGDAPAQPTPLKSFFTTLNAVFLRQLATLQRGPNLISLGWRGFLSSQFLSVHSPLLQREWVCFLHLLLRTPQHPLLGLWVVCHLFLVNACY